MATLTTEPTIVGRTLDGKYRIERPIGRGGMGAVFLATHVGTGRPVAVKVILSDLVEDSEAVERFRREAQAAGQIRHPNIVDVTDFGVTRVGTRETAYLVMEYLEGRSLGEQLELQGALPLGWVVEIVEQIAVALAVAHRAGIVHRDLKPDNVWLSPDPRGGHVVRVLDFGIARLRAGRRAPEPPPAAPAVDVATGNAPPRPPAQDDLSPSGPGGAGGDGDSSPTDGPDLTIQGATLGTPAYMSPEQCLGIEVDERSDLYSLGVVTFEAITGQPPFRGTYSQLVASHVHQAPRRVDQLTRGIPAAVAGVVARALAKDPAARHQSATAFAGSLRVAAEGPGVVLQRALVLYAERFESFFRISLRTARPLVVALIAFVAAFALLRDQPRMALWLAMIIGVGAWGQVVMMSNAAFASAIERLRTRPLQAMDVKEVFADMRARIGLPRDAGDLRTMARLFSLYVRTESKAPAGRGDLSFLIAFYEGLAPTEAGRRCRELAPAVTQSYRWVGFSLIVCTGLVIALEALVAINGFGAVDRSWARTASLLFLSAALPLNAVCITPVFSSAFALLYFRARQANGEDVAISAIVPTRL